jgi:hypothetical protein
LPRYYFHIVDSVVLPDEDGLELPDIAAAKVEAVKSAGEMLHDHAERFWASPDWKVIVTGEDRTVLFSIDCRAFDAPDPAPIFDPEAGPNLIHVKPH